MEQHEQNQPAGAPAENQLRQIRASLKNQIAELKKQVAQIQQQSLKVLQQSIDTAFNAQTGGISEQMRNQAVPVPPTDPGIDPAGSQAVATAMQSVEQAMQAAAQSIENAEKILNSLGQAAGCLAEE
ncbi:MAG: hypothetical protein ABW019_10160 [Chitinophagaceae bacterium]